MAMVAMGEKGGVEALLARPIQIADEVCTRAGEADSFKQECMDLKKQIQKLSGLLRQAVRASSGAGLYERPTRRIIQEINKVLEKALVLVTKCRRKRLFAITSTAAFKKIGLLLDSSIGDVTWLLNVSANDEDDDRSQIGLPPIATNDPMLGLIWEQIARLHTGSPSDKADAAASLLSLAKDNPDRNAKLIVEEGGITPLLKLINYKETAVATTAAAIATEAGVREGQEAAARTLGYLGRDPDRVREMMEEGVCSAFAKVLKDSPMKLQSTVAWALSEMLSDEPQPDWQDRFAHSGVIRSLVGHLAFESLQEGSKYLVTGKPSVTIHSLVTTSLASKVTDAHTLAHLQKDTAAALGLPSLSGLNLKGRSAEDPAVKASLKAEAAKALWKIAKNNINTCKAITESKALLCFAIMLEKGQGHLQYNSAMAVMEIAAVAEQTSELRRVAFKPNSPAAKALVEQMLRIITQDDEDAHLLMACIKAIGCLARTFPARETRLIAPLVKHLDHREPSVCREAAIALAKFGCKENYLHMERCKSIIEAGAAPFLIQLVYFGDSGVSGSQIPALILLCYLALHVGDSEALAKAEALSSLEWASKQPHLVQDPTLDKLLPEAKGRLELYQSRGSRFH